MKELEQGHRASSMERVLKRNRELEDEVEKLRARVAIHPTSIPPEMPREPLIPQKVTLDWMPESHSPHWPATNQNSALEVDNPTSTTSYPSRSAPFHTSNTAYAEEVSSPLYTANISAAWDSTLEFTSAAVTKSVPAWAPFHDNFSQPSRFSDLQTSGFNELINNPTSFNSTCWQNQPSVYAWQISTKLKAPSTYVDQLMFNCIHSQRHLAMNAGMAGEELLGPAFPSVHILFNQPGPIEKNRTKLTEVMAQYSAVLSNRGFALIPEKLASFMCMYRFVQWQISPNYQTYQTLHEWQAPRPSQLMIPHPAWMDLPPWGKFREKVIENQAKYDNVEFQTDYASNLSVNFPHDPMKALIFEGGQILISPVLDKHLSDISNMSMKKPFADKYPEFSDACRFDEV